MVPFHYPPMVGSSGVQRSLVFSANLALHGWVPTILTAHPRAHQRISQESMGAIPKDVSVKRVFALDTAKHLSFRGRYLKWMALPDRWFSWFFAGVWSGWRIIRNEKPSLLWSTYPIPTAHVIALTLHRLTGIPWVADFRDPMVEENYPEDPTTHKLYRWIEKQVAKYAVGIVVTTPGVKRMYLERYPFLDSESVQIIENGYDEEKFRRVEESLNNNSLHSLIREESAPLRVVHSGVVYPSERDPTQLFKALSSLKKEGVINSAILRLELRATGCDDLYANMIEDHSLEDIVCLLPAISHEACIEDMFGADALLLLQASNCNDQIPAKLYEYFRLRKPIIALTDPDGDTARCLKEVGVDTIAPLDDEAAIKALLSEIVKIVREGSPIKESQIVAFSRQNQTSRLAKIFDHLMS